MQERGGMMVAAELQEMEVRRWAERGQAVNCAEIWNDELETAGKRWRKRGE